MLGLLFMLPAALLLLVSSFTYPLSRHLVGFHQHQTGHLGNFIGLENYRSLMHDTVFGLSVSIPSLHHRRATSSFMLGLWLRRCCSISICPSRRFCAHIMLLPFIVFPPRLFGDRIFGIYDSQFSIISWVLIKMGWIDKYINFLGDPNMARASVIAANVWRGVPLSRFHCCRAADNPAVADEPRCSMARHRGNAATSPCLCSRRLSRS
jgi:multiple sugar transport system permease protein